MVNRFVLAIAITLTLIGSGCSDIETPDSPPRYTPATSDYGEVIAAWVYPDDGKLSPPPRTKLVAAELRLPPPEGGKFDLDDIDIFDADTGENFGSDPYIQRLTLNGEFVDSDDPEVEAQREYRGIFVWAVPEEVKRVNFGYWGEMLYVEPVPLGSRELNLPHMTVSAISIERAGDASRGYDRYRAVLHAQQSFRNFEPRWYTLVGTRAPKEKDICDSDAWIEVDAARLPVRHEMRERPYVVNDRWFLVEYWCPNGTTPDRLNLFGSHSPLPPVTAPPTPREAYEALEKAPREKHALHRLK
ncbi:MAG: hypothetical protein ACYC60_20695 [Thermoanaerobaculia bacterium]